MVQVESDLAQWCVLELGLGADVLQHIVDWRSRHDALTSADLEERVDLGAYARLWGTWRGREQEFFRRCAELVSPLSWADVLAACGPSARMHALLVMAPYRRLTSEKVHPALKVGRFHVEQIEAGCTRVSTYLASDPLDVPDTLMQLLPFFDGRPTDEALAVIAQERGINLDPELVRKLVDFQLLVPAGQATE
jgi:hypothetical protein